MTRPKALPSVTIYTDGACSPNPGTGGWAVVLISHNHGNHTKELSGAERQTTNNRMEMTAAIMGLRALKSPCAVQLFTDSEYLMKGFTAGWVESWRRNGWRTASKKPVANVDLWQALDALTKVHEIRWQWVRGHADDEINHRCDALAVKAREKLAASQ